jgi:glyoxylase-like metal-dependent hydrolase (beta-lactamase superfamily II)
MIIEHSQLENFLTNTYLVADREGGSAVLVDAGGPMDPLLARIDELGVTLTHVLLTHHHYDHIVELDKVVAEHPGVPVLIHPLERELVPQATGELQSGETVTSGDLSIEALHTPGHTAGMLALVANGSDVFTGDTLFKGSVGGVRAPGSTSFADLHSSVMDRLMGLDHEIVVHPGHTDPTTIGEEWETNAFIRVWRGLDREGSEPCVALGEPATLVLWAPDYDGGHKAWVRWPDGRDDIVPGSQVQRGEE